MRCNHFAVAIVLTLLVGCDGASWRPAAALAGDQEPAAHAPSELSPSAATVPEAPSEQPASAAPAAVRQYPSFRDAVTEMPPWNDAHPPFDLAKFLEAPIVEKSAAPLYLDALREFDDEVDGLFSESSEEEQRRRWTILKVHVGNLIFRLAAPPASVRTWTDNTGRHSIEAEVVEVNSGNVVLRKARGKTVTLPLGKLSQVNRHHLKLLGHSGEVRP